MEPGRTRTLMSWLIAASYIYAFAACVIALFDVVQIIQNLQPGAAVPLTLPASTVMDPHSGSLHYSGSAYVAQGYVVTFTQVSLYARAVPVWAIVVMGIGHIATALSAAAIAWIVWRLLRRIRAGEPFIASAPRLIIAAGVIVAGGLTLGDILVQIGQSGVGSVAFIAAHGDFEAGPYGFNLDLVPVFFGLLLLVVAFVFRQGTKLQRETDGLV
jgi:hypothetical protein